MLRTREAADYTELAKSTVEKLRVSGGGCPHIGVGRVARQDATSAQVNTAARQCCS